MYEDGWARVRVGGRESTWFQAKSGVRQGCLLSLSMALQHLYRQDSDTSKEEIRWKRAAIYRAVRGANVCSDLIMLAEREEALQHNLQKLNDRLDEWGMKARVMRVGRKHGMSKLMERE